METRASRDTHRMKEKDILDGIEDDASSKVSENKRTAMSELIRAKALSCSLYDMDCRKLAEEHKFVAREYLKEIISFVLSDCPYKAGRDQSDELTKYDLFG